MTKARILVVEDEVIIAMEIENSLRNLGYEVTSIVDRGDDAIKKAEEDNPDLILMDIRVKGDQDGIETAAMIRERFGIPVIFSTAYLDEERIERAKITMPFGYVLKPMQERDLKVTLEMALYVAKVDAEKRKAEKIMLRSQATLNAANQIAKIGGWEIDLEKQYTYWTDEMYRIHDLQTNRFAGQDERDNELKDPLNPDEFTANNEAIQQSSTCYNPEDRQKLMEAFRRCMDEAQPYDFELPFTSVKGVKKWVRTITYPVKKRDKVVKLRGILADITDSKRTEDALRKSEFQFSQLFYQSSTSMCLYSPSGTIEKANPEFCKMFGVEEEEIVKSQYNMFQDQAIEDGGVIPHLETLFYQKKPACWKVEFDLDIASESTGTETVKSGMLELEVFGYPILDDKDNLQHVVLQHYDITERKENERKLTESERKYRELFNSAPAGMYCIDFRTYRITEINDQACANLGYSKKEILDMLDPLELLDELSRKKFFERMNKIKNHQPIPTVEEFSLRKKDGTMINALLNIQLIYEDNEIVGARVVAHDITRME